MYILLYTPSFRRDVWKYRVFLRRRQAVNDHLRDPEATPLPEPGGGLVGASDQGRWGDFPIFFPIYIWGAKFFQEPQNLQNHRVVKERMFLWDMIQFVSDLDGFNLTATTIATSRFPSNFNTQYFKLKPRFLIQYWMVVSWFAVFILRSRSPFMIYWL